VEKYEGGKLLERPMDRWNNNVKVYLKEVEVRARTGFVWLRVGTSGDEHGN